VGAGGARLSRFPGQRRARIVVAVVEYNFEAPIGRQSGRLLRIQVRKIWYAVGVPDALQIAVGGARLIRAIAFVSSRCCNPIRVFGVVLVADDVTLVVIALANQPGKDASRIGGVGKAGLPGLAVPGGGCVVFNGSATRGR